MASALKPIAIAILAAGFVVSPAFLPDTFEDFVDAVVPILQQKALLRRDYQGRTLRDHLGMAPTT